MNETNKTIGGVMEYLNDSLRKVALKETEWLIQKNNYENRVTELEAQLKASENINYDMLKRIKMLEYALCTERNKVLRLGGQIENDIKFSNSVISNEMEEKRELIKEEDLKKLKDSSTRPSLMKMLNDLGINETFANELFNDLEINKTEFEKQIKTNIEAKSNKAHDNVSKAETNISANNNYNQITTYNNSNTINNLDSSILSNSSLASVESVIKMSNKNLSNEEQTQFEQKVKLVN